VVILGQTLWRIATHVNTVLHEAAHAFVGLGTGRRVGGVTMTRAGGGGTKLAPASGLGFIVAVIVGYVGPSAAGLVVATLISAGLIVAVLWLGLLLVVAMLLMVRQLFGGIVILTCGVLLFLLVRYTTVGVQTAVAYALAWFLLLSGPKAVIEAGSNPKDAQILARLTPLWASAWTVLWLIGTLAAVWVGGAMLL
jgi:Peptidase M50B-like